MSSSAMRVAKHRAALRNQGLKLVQIWVPDVHSKVFASECKKQSRMVKQSDDEEAINSFIADNSDFRGWK